MTSPQVFERLGGTFQYKADTPDKLPEILDLDLALWAALCAPLEAMNGNAKFFSYLDSDGNKLVRVDDVKIAIRFLLTYLKNLDTLKDSTPAMAIEDLSTENDEAKALYDFAVSRSCELAQDNVLKLDVVSAKLAAVTAGALKGDGIITAGAIAAVEGAKLFAEVSALSGGTKNAGGAVGITSAQLANFITDAKAFLDWAQSAEQPMFREKDPTLFYAAYQSMKAKLDEYFLFCELLQLDESNALRFRIDPAKMPELDIYDTAAVRAALQKAPLAPPDSNSKLMLKESVNPFYAKAAETFAQVFELDSLTSAQWTAIKNDFAPYEAYLAKAQGNNIGAMGREKLQALLNGGGEAELLALFERDGKLGSVLGSLRKLEQLLLYKQYFMEFIRNFVNLSDLFSADRRSLIQAGKLVMDGRTFCLNLRISDVASHKKIAVRSNLCMIYLELDVQGAVLGKKLYIATVITHGDLTRIYVGKPAFFIDADGKHYSGKIVDLVEGPISFWQTVLSPFRRLGNVIGDKIQKLTDFSGVEKKLETSINTGTAVTAPPPPPTQPGYKNVLNNGTMMLLAGGLSFAAIAAAFGVVMNSVNKMIATISAMSWLSIGTWVLTIVLLVFTPLALNAVIRLRKRNLTLFFEAAGWALNLPLRLGAEMSRFFSFPGHYPEGAKFRIFKLDRKKAPALRKTTKVLFIIFWVVALSYFYFRYR